MFLYELLPDREGPRLIAAKEVWAQLRETVCQVANGSPILEDNEPFQGLGYDASKAQPIQVECFGERHYADFSWPALLIQAAMLRQSLAFLVHSKDDQAITYALEAVIEKALAEDFETYAPAIIHAWKTVDVSRFTQQRNINEIIAPYFTWSPEQRAEHLESMVGMPGWLESERGE